MAVLSPTESPQPELAGDAEEASSDSESSVRLSMPRRSRVVTFTCNKCGRQPIMACIVGQQTCTYAKAFNSLPIAMRATIEELSMG